ncbi:MAG TPA: hypothetical protein VFQ63_04380 [Patescibacteria group bacterium]|nr:hypothetical protein [Patescibacteria group bacterium]
MPEVRPHINPQTGKFDVHIKNTTIGAQETLKGTVNQLVDQDMRNTGRFNFLKRGWLRLSQPFRKIGYEKTVKQVIERTGSYYVSSDAVREAAEQAQEDISERRRQLKEEGLKDKLKPTHFLERGKLALRRKTVAREYTARAAEALQRQAGTQGAADRERFLVHEATQVARMQAEGEAAFETGELPQGLELLSKGATDKLVADVIAPLVTGRKSRLIKSNLSEANIYRALRKFTQRGDLPEADKAKLASMFGEKSTVIKMRAENFASDVIAVAKAIQEDAQNRHWDVSGLSTDLIGQRVGRILIAKDDIAKDALAHFSSYDQLVAQINNRVPLGAVAVVAAATAIAGQYAIRSGLRHIPFVGSALVGGLMGGVGKHAEVSRTVKEYRLAKGENPSSVPVPSPDKKLKKLQEFDFARRSVHDLLTNPTEQRNPKSGEITKRKGLNVLAQEYQAALTSRNRVAITRAEEALLEGIGEIQARLNLFDERRTHLDFDGSSPIALIQGMLDAKRAIVSSYGNSPATQDLIMQRVGASTQTEMQRFRQQMGTTNAEFNRYRAIEVAKAAAVGAVAGAVVGFISQELALEGGDLLAWAVEHAKPVIEEGIHVAQQGLDAAGNFIHNIPSVGGALDAAGNAIHHAPGVGGVVDALGNAAHGARSNLEFFLSREGRGHDIYKNGGAFTVELQGHGDEISIGQDHSVWLLDGSGTPHLVGAIDANHVLHTTTDINHLPPGLAHEFSQHGIKVEHADSLQQYIMSGEPPPPGSGLPPAPEGTYWGVGPDGKWDLVDAYNPQHILLREVFVDSKGFHFDPNHVDPALGMPEGVRGITSESSSILSPFLHSGPESQSWITAHQLEFYDKPSFDGGWHAIEIQAPPNSNFLQVVIPGKGDMYIHLPANHQLLFDPNDHNANYTFQVLDKSGHLTTMRGDQLSQLLVNQNEVSAMHQAGAGGTELAPQFRSVFTIANDGQRGVLSSVNLTEANGAWDTSHVAHTATIFGTGRLPTSITTGAESSQVPAYLYYNSEQPLTPAEELQEGLIIAGAGATLATFMTALLLKAKKKEGQDIAFNASLTSFIVTSALLTPAMPWLGAAGVLAGTGLLLRNIAVQRKKAKAAKGGKQAKAQNAIATPAAAPVQPPSQPPPTNAPQPPGAPKPLVAPFVAAALTDTERQLPTAQRADKIAADIEALTNADQNDAQNFAKAYNKVIAHGLDDKLPPELAQDPNIQRAKENFIVGLGQALESTHPELGILMQQMLAAQADPQNFARLQQEWKQKVLDIYNSEIVPQPPLRRDPAIQQAEAAFVGQLVAIADQHKTSAPTQQPPQAPGAPAPSIAELEAAEQELSALGITGNVVDALSGPQNGFGANKVEILAKVHELSPAELAALQTKLRGITDPGARAQAVRDAYDARIAAQSTGPQSAAGASGSSSGSASSRSASSGASGSSPATSPSVGATGPSVNLDTQAFARVNSLLDTPMRSKDALNAEIAKLQPDQRDAIFGEGDPAKKAALIAQFLNPAPTVRNPSIPNSTRFVDTGMYAALSDDFRRRFPTPDSVNAALSQLPDAERQDIERQIHASSTAQEGERILEQALASTTNPAIAIDAKAGLEALGFDDMLLSEIKRPSQHFVDSDTDLLARIQAMTPAARAKMLGEMRTLPHPLDQANLVLRAIAEDEMNRQFQQPPEASPIPYRPPISAVFGAPGSAEGNEFNETMPHMAVREGDFQRFVRDTMMNEGQPVSRAELQRQFERFNSALRFAYKNPDESAWEDFKKRYYGFWGMTREMLADVSPEKAFAYLLAEAHNSELLNPPGVTLADIPQREAEIARQEGTAFNPKQQEELAAQKRELSDAQRLMVDTFLAQEFSSRVESGFRESLRLALLAGDSTRIEELRQQIDPNGIANLPTADSLLSKFVFFRDNNRFTIKNTAGHVAVEEVKPGEALTDEERKDEINSVLRALKPIPGNVADMPTEQHPTVNGHPLDFVADEAPLPDQTSTEQKYSSDVERLRVKAFDVPILLAQENWTPPEIVDIIVKDFHKGSRTSEEYDRDENEYANRVGYTNQFNRIIEDTLMDFPAEFVSPRLTQARQHFYEAVGNVLSGAYPELSALRQSNPSQYRERVLELYGAEIANILPNERDQRIMDAELGLISALEEAIIHVDPSAEKRLHGGESVPLQEETTERETPQLIQERDALSAAVRNRGEDEDLFDAFSRYLSQRFSFLAGQEDLLEMYFDDFTNNNLSSAEKNELLQNLLDEENNLRSPNPPSQMV